MIKEQINITCGGSTYENCTLIVPSQVQTSTPQEETLDLEKSPNFQIVVPGVYLDKGTHEITFSVGGNDCTANMIVVNNGSVSCTLQYVDGMTIEEGDSSDDSSDDEPTGPQSLSDVRQLENNTEFTFDGTVTVINKSSNNRELYIQDADGSAGIKMYQNNIGSSFSTGDVIHNGWTATKSVYNGVTQLGSISNLNYSGDTTTLIANELSIPSFTESDTYNYYVFRNITINGNTIEDGVGNTMAIYNQFSTTIPSDAQHYDAYGVVGLHNSNVQFWPMSFEPVGGDDGSSDDPDEPTVPTFTYSGSDQNNPIQVNVDLSGAGESGPDPMSFPFTFTFSGPDDTYTWDEFNSWKCGNYMLSMGTPIRSDSNIYSIVSNDATLNNSTWICEDAGFWAGPMEAGTYIESWTLTFNYNKDYSQIHDETTGEQLDDPVAQSLDGTTITFWVQFNVTGTIPNHDKPTETITWSQDPFVVNVTAGSQSNWFTLTGTDSNSNSITVARDAWNYTINPDDGVITGGTKVERFVADATNLTAGTYNYDIACEHGDEYGVAHIQVVVS